MRDIIRVSQLPVIEERLRELRENIEARTAEACALVCTEESLSSIKKTRAELNKELAELENQRKSAKTAVMEPYNQFESIYRECVSDPFRRADAELKTKINAVEAEMIGRCRAAAEKYFTDLCTERGLSIDFNRVGIKIGLADAKKTEQPPKNIREQLKTLVDGVEMQVNLIQRMDDAEEILVEFWKTLDSTAAIATVQERREAVKREREAAARRENIKQQLQDAETAVQAMAPPKPVEPVEMLTATFTVTDTKERLLKLKQFLLENKYKF